MMQSICQKGVYNTFQQKNLRYSQMAPLDMYKEVNTKTNLPAQIDLYAVPGSDYKFLFVAKGGGSANKTYFFQKTKALLNPKSLEEFVRKEMLGLGTAACPPYHFSDSYWWNFSRRQLKDCQIGFMWLS